MHLGARRAVGRYAEAYARVPEDLAEIEGLRALAAQAWPPKD